MGGRGQLLGDSLDQRFLGDHAYQGADGGEKSGMIVGLSMPALQILVAANPIDAAPRVREMLIKFPPERRRAAFERLIARVGLGPQQAFDLQGHMAPELTVEYLAGPNVRRSIRRVYEALTEGPKAILPPNQEAWRDPAYWRRWGGSFYGKNLPGASDADLAVCLRYRMLLEFEREWHDLRTGEVAGMVTAFRASPLFATY
jgi:hypothetical protein